MEQPTQSRQEHYYKLPKTSAVISRLPEYDQKYKKIHTRNEMIGFSKNKIPPPRHTENANYATLYSS